jgi:hypothetical protein
MGHIEKEKLKKKCNNLENIVFLYKEGGHLKCPSAPIIFLIIFFIVFN